MKKQKGFIVPLLVVVITILIVGGFVYTKSKDKNQLVDNMDSKSVPKGNSVVSTTSTQIGALRANQDSQVNIQYLGASYGFYFPPDWKIDTNTKNDEFLILSSKTKTHKVLTGYPEVPNSIMISLVLGKIKEGSFKKVILNGRVWFTMETKASLDDNPVNSLIYQTYYNQDKFLEIQADPSDQGIAEGIAASLITG